MLIVIRALYGLNSTGSSWRKAVAQVLKELDFVSTLSEPDVWIQEAVREGGFKYYDILFVYINDILAVLHEATDIMKEIKAFYRVKEESIKPPDIYFCANIMKVQMPHVREVWGPSSRDFMNNAIIKVEQLFEEDVEGFTLRNTVKAPFPTGYKPELDVTEELGLELASMYLQLIGIC